MRRLLLVVAMGLLIAVPVAAQPTPGVDVILHRIDVTQTDAGLDVLEHVTFYVGDATAFGGNLTLRVPSAAEGFQASILVNASQEPIPADRVVLQGVANANQLPLLQIRLDGTEVDIQDNGTYQVQVAYEVPQATAFATTLWDPADRLVLFFRAMDDVEILPIGLGQPVPTGDGRYHLQLEDVPSGFTVAVAFQPEISPFRDFTTYVWFAAGLAVGLFAMWVSVKQGWVSVARTRRFEKGGEMESRSTLEARRRTLMAAMKDLEVGHEAKEIPDDAYAPLKEEYKVQAVRVMRSLDEKTEKE